MKIPEHFHHQDTHCAKALSETISITEAVAKAPCLCRNSEAGQTCLGCDARKVLGIEKVKEKE